MCEVKKVILSGVSKGTVSLMTNIIHVGIKQFDGLDRVKGCKWLYGLRMVAARR